jgi:hypothetical protein
MFQSEFKIYFGICNQQLIPARFPRVWHFFTLRNE